MNRKTLITPLAAAVSVGLLCPPETRAASKTEPIDPAGIARLAPAAEVKLNPATGAARFVTLRETRTGGLLWGAARSAAARQARTTEFFRTHGSVFGISNPEAELQTLRSESDEVGASIVYAQVYQGVPVFGAQLRSHFDAAGNLIAVNGTFVPGIRVNARPTRSAQDAGARAVRKVEEALQRSGGLSARATTLMVFREGLARGVPGPNHLAWEVEVTGQDGTREFVYVDAHTNKVIDQITGVYDAINRRAYDGNHEPNVPATYPGTPFWVEGQPFPTGNAEADNMLISSQETYNFFLNAFGRASFDGADATMDSIFNRGYQCPNASWNGTFISFCEGLTTDDVTGHEWGHAYTQYTHNLIYQWQPGALNESYSDIWGETIDRINGRGGDTPDAPRTADACSSIWGTPPPELTITGGTAAGSYNSLVSVMEPPLPVSAGPLPMVQAVPAGACTPLTNAADVNGKIVLIDWTLVGVNNECGSVARANNAIAANAAAIIFVAAEDGFRNLTASAGILSLQVSHEDGDVIKAGLAGANATLTIAIGTDDSVRWLLGEDDTNPDLEGALRDMWNPRCFGNPGKVTDTFEYVCSLFTDGGGVHINSGIPNHAYALLVDGGTYNGRTVSPIGLTKAAHIYYRAMTKYQGPATTFPEHADALQQSCRDLMGKDLKSLTTGQKSGEIITKKDCLEVADAIAAVELRTEPDFCHFEPLLDPTSPRLCPAGQRIKPMRKLPAGKFTVSHDDSVDADERDWSVVGKLPSGRKGKAFFAANPDGGACAAGFDQSGVQHLDSPVITVPAGATSNRLTFVHWMSTEFGFDGGNVKISVNGGPWTLIEFTEFVHNGYNIFLAGPGDSTNPIAGEQAFSGADGGSVLGSWGRSIVDLSSFVGPGDSFQIRFDLGQDCGTGQFGWYLDVDELSAYSCQ
jgi:Zn-dependent metalloprotease